MCFVLQLYCANVQSVTPVGLVFTFFFEKKESFSELTTTKSMICEFTASQNTKLN